MIRNLTINFEGDRVAWTGCNNSCGIKGNPNLEMWTPVDFHCILQVVAQGSLYFCAHPQAHRFTDGSLKLCMVRAGKMTDENVELVVSGKTRISE